VYFREHVAEHKNPWGISENEMPAGMGILFFELSCIAFSL
jgi:hypothetical protein